MRKSLFVVGSLAAILVAGNAMALDVSRERTVRVAGFGEEQSGTLGTLVLTALGQSGDSCDYLAAWASPVNPNDAVLCLLHERRTPFAPSCIANEREDITSVISAGGEETEQPQAPQPPQPQAPTSTPHCGQCEPQVPPQQPTETQQPTCAGFDIKGESFESVSLMLSEGPAGLQGIQVIPSPGLPVIYPIVVE